jgi:hypothetical protein
MGAAPFRLLVTVVVGTETHRSGGALIYGVFRLTLGLRGTLGRWIPTPRHRGGAEVPVVPVADGG